MDLNIKNAAFIPVITALVQIFKMLGVSKKLCPFMSLVFGLILGILLEDSGEIKKGILNGIVLGTSASGLYSSTKVAYEIGKKKTD
ncbi:hypothetical protein [Clostridium grantii]|uniref:Holin n=1 Tax=Clostridium grantii DSM 8605 TaxID=1121316 RepID=A0A1M5XK94_9CLOT|nr:hypothetical protein [Clostridium grantii]SHI00240.1 hypothetical protein SAMN02745207_03730 [Clostridium grantii DSM 8605]